MVEAHRADRLPDRERVVGDAGRAFEAEEIVDLPLVEERQGDPIAVRREVAPDGGRHRAERSGGALEDHRRAHRAGGDDHDQQLADLDAEIEREQRPAEGRLR